MLTSGDVILVDAEHFGIRLLMPLLTIGGAIGGFFLGSAIMNQIDQSLAGACLGIPMAIALAALLVQIGERVIKPNWTSGRHIELTGNDFTLVDQRSRRNERVTFNFMQDLKVDGWYFEILERRHRVPKGWYCTAAQFAQNGQEVIIYTFINPEEIQEIKNYMRLFEQLERTKKKSPQSGQHISDVRLATHQKYLRALEDKRWEDGAEVTPDDFKKLMQHM
ncbi:MAG: hypothetical protein L0154_20100 [Chloroflexi bacterium]|nr:hypothetical protein [Chloroflexota bacterium]